MGYCTLLANCVVCIPLAYHASQLDLIDISKLKSQHLSGTFAWSEQISDCPASHVSCCSSLANDAKRMPKESCHLVSQHTTATYQLCQMISTFRARARQPQGANCRITSLASSPEAMMSQNMVAVLRLVSLHHLSSLSKQP